MLRAPFAGIPFLAVLGVGLCCSPLFAQSNNLEWPQIKLSACPNFVLQSNMIQRIWRHGEPEKDAFQVAVDASKKSDWKGVAAALGTFISRFPDSDYRDAALALEAAAYVKLKDTAGEVTVAQQMVAVPSAAAGVRVAGFVLLLDSLTTSVLPGDAAMEGKLADMDRWVECGRKAYEAAGPPPSGTGAITEGVFERTEGFIALMRKNYVAARTSLKNAIESNSEDALSYLFLVETEAFDSPPDTDAAIFYMARFTDLRPALPRAEALLERIYKLDCGSKKGLKQLKSLAQTNTTPPADFAILPKQKEKHNYTGGIAVAALVGLVVYGEIATHGAILGGSPAVENPASNASGKIMLFGGPGHAAYLGCLNCGEFAEDSVFNRTGQNGSSLGAESIWNHYGEYGSPYSAYSACNQFATDPPVIVDEHGTAYGRLTVNRNLAAIGTGGQLYGWLSSKVCAAR